MQLTKYILLLLISFNTVCFGQAKPRPQTDLNTIYICIDSLSYGQLFKNKYVKDTLFFCKEANLNTTDDAYNGKYWIGESATIEFFQPQHTNHNGDHWGDYGIEFKTRKINTLPKIIHKANQANYKIETEVKKIVVDSVTIPWYQAIGFTTGKSELSVLEYQEEYLENLGFTKRQISTPMSFKEYNLVLSNGRKYPRQFSMITYIKLLASKKQIENIEQFAILNNYKIKSNTISNKQTTIEYILVDDNPAFPILEVRVSLINKQHYRIVRISDKMQIVINGKEARIVFESKQTVKTRYTYNN